MEKDVFCPQRRDSLCGTVGLMWHLEAWQIASKSQLWAQMSPWSLNPVLCVCLILSFPNLHWTDRKFAGLSTMYHPVFSRLWLSLSARLFPCLFSSPQRPRCSQQMTITVLLIQGQVSYSNLHGEEGSAGCVYMPEWISWWILQPVAGLLTALKGTVMDRQERWASETSQGDKTDGWMGLSGNWCMC